MERCLILDFDDTLVSTIETHADSWRHALERVLNRDIPLSTIMADINYGMDVLLKKYHNLNLYLCPFNVVFPITIIKE